MLRNIDGGIINCKNVGKEANANIANLMVVFRIDRGVRATNVHRQWPSQTRLSLDFVNRSVPFFPLFENEADEMKTNPRFELAKTNKSERKTTKREDENVEKQKLFVFIAVGLKAMLRRWRVFFLCRVHLTTI